MDIQNISLTLIVGAVSSIIASIIYNTFPLLLGRFGKRLTQNRFKIFFGEVTLQTRGAIIVFPDRVALSAKWKVFVDEEFRKACDRLGVSNAEPEGLNSWVPMQDLRGANYVGSELSSQVQKTPFFRTDRDLASDSLDQIRGSVFTFGLGFNQFTYRIINITEHALFDVRFSESPRDVFVGYKDTNETIRDCRKITTDNIVFNGSVLVPKLGSDFAIVARVPHPSPKDAPSRYFFICAGRTASGTAAAGQFLANNWPKLLKLYKKSHDLRTEALIIVIKHCYHTADSEDDAAQIATDDNGQPMIRWWKNPKFED